jgi:hypothetical protein
MTTQNQTPGRERTEAMTVRMTPLRHTIAVAAAAMTAMTLGACDFDVINPGPTEDQYLDSLNAHEAVVTGARHALGDAMENITYWGAAMVFEVNPAGSTGSFGIPTYIQAGRFNASDNGDYDAAQEARWVAEDALRRFESVLPEIDGAPAFDQYEPAALAALYAGYSNRLLGENFCQVVFDQADGMAGSPEPQTAAFARAEGYFTTAIQIGGNVGDDEVVTAAQAGRASVRALLARYGMASWADAASDAQAVANDFVFAMEYSDQEQAQYNRIFFANANVPYRAHTIWATWYEDYFETTGDPRVVWEVGDCPNCPDPNNPTGDAAVDKFGGQVPWFTQMKYDEEGSPINLSSGWEMRLIEAEAALDAGDVPEAVALMNLHIDALNADPDYPDANIPQVTAASVAEGYTALKAQRAYELWMEGRRMGDIRSWDENSTPGTYNDGVWENGTRTEDLSTRHRAYPLGDSERDTNPNVPISPVFCTP